MRVALITTTVNVPRVLELYRNIAGFAAECGRIKFFVAGDKNTPREAYEFVLGLGRCGTVCLPESGYQYKCSELLGWNNDSRRNIALLEAVKWGAEIIVSVDDDMLPLGDDVFKQFECALMRPFSGLELGSPGNWFDAGCYTIPQARQRGLPFGCAIDNSGSFVCDAQVGAMQGIILGTPDTDVVTMLASGPSIVGVTDILRNGFVVDPEAKAVMNSQFTAFRRELAPCFAQFYKWQHRNTDIFASLIMRRVMREMNLYTYYGPPMGFHARTPRDSLKDLKAEMWGLERVERFATYLDRKPLSGASVMENVRAIYQGFNHDPNSYDLLEQANVDCALAFLDDMEGVL